MIILKYIPEEIWNADWTHWALDRDPFRALMNTGMIF
jgi:hypothetical protein